MNKLIDEYYKNHFRKYGFLESIKLRQNVNPSNWNGFDLSIDLRSDADTASPLLRFVFTEVQELRIGVLSGLMNYKIEIEWIGLIQQERIQYKIHESEYDAISFICYSVDFNVEQDVSPIK